MRTRDAKMIDHARQIDGKITEIESAVVVVARAIAARIPGDGMKMRTNDGKLIVPVSAIATDAVEKNRQRTGSLVIHRDPGRPGYNISRPCRHRPSPQAEDNSDAPSETALSRYIELPQSQPPTLRRTTSLMIRIESDGRVDADGNMLWKLL
jgi:hypothetical protein